MAFLADLLMAVLTIVYIRINHKLYRWRLEVTEKYPHTHAKIRPLKADLRGMWEFFVSISLICGLFVAWMSILILPAHTSAQVVLMPGIFYWSYTFISVATYPTSHQLVRWLGKQGKKLLSKSSA